MPFVVAYHLIVTAYGFWLPNDPRGSWSQWVRAWELLRFGPATKTDERRSVARRPHDRARRLEAKRHLARAPVEFTGEQALAIAHGFATYVRRSGVVIYACSILPTHCHAVVARHRYSVEQISNLLKGAASTALLHEGLHPFAGNPYADGTLPTPWARGKWDRFLGCDEDVVRSIDYTNSNPGKERKPRQTWSFVTRYTG
jgi:REP element-mobilizing transposase RayT